MTSITQGPSSIASGSGWIGSELNSEHIIAGGSRVDATAFNAEDAVKVTLSAQGTAGATSLTFTALTGPIPSGTLLYFGAGLYARTTAAAAAGATTVAVEALPATIANSSVATYPGTGKKLIVAGTLLGRTIAEQDAGALWGPAADTDDMVLLAVHDVSDAAKDPDVELYMPGSVVKYNYLPVWTGLSTALKTKLRATYTMIRGAN